MLGALAPIISTNIATSMCPYVFASDASLGKGAVVCTSVEEKVAEAMWVGADKKGSYSKLDSFPCDLLAAAGEELSGDVEACEFVVEPKRLCSCTTILSSSLVVQAVFPKLPTD